MDSFDCTALLATDSCDQLYPALINFDIAVRTAKPIHQNSGRGVVALSNLSDYAGCTERTKSDCRRTTSSDHWPFSAILLDEDSAVCRSLAF